MKTTALPLPNARQNAAALPLYKLLFTKKSIRLLLWLVFAVVAFFAARCTVLGFCAPFAIALSASLPAELMPAAVLGGAIGHLSAGYESVPIRYLAALLILVFVKRVFSKKNDNHPLFNGIASLLSCAVTGIAAAVLTDRVEQTLFAYVAESFIAGASAVLWSGAAQLLQNFKSTDKLRDSEAACLLFSAFLVAFALGNFTVLEISPARILTCFIILLSAYYGKTGGGALAGIGGGTALGLCLHENFAFSALSLGGMLSGIGASHSRLLALIGLEVGMAAPLLFGLEPLALYAPFAEAGIAGLVFLVLPSTLLRRLRFFSAFKKTAPAEAVEKTVTERLLFACEALSDIALTVRDTDATEQKTLQHKKTDIYLKTLQSTCNGCGLRYYCWEREKQFTVSVFKKMEEMLATDSLLTVQTLPSRFAATCIKSDTLIKNFTLEHALYSANRLAAQRADGMRSALRVQFDALSQLLFDLAGELDGSVFVRREQSNLLEELLEHCEAVYSQAQIITTAAERSAAVIKVPYRQEVLEKEAFLKDLESICGTQMLPAECTQYDGAFKLAYFEKAPFRLNSAFYQINADGNRECGDAVENFTDFHGKSGTVLADGMGKGSAAHLKASFSAGVMAKLLSSGFSPAAALKTVNAALIVKDRDESFSSLDTFLFDRYTGTADFYKAGATATFIKAKGKIRQLEMSGLPVGILENADFAHRALSLSAGDVVLLVSDGVTQGRSDWIAPLLTNPAFSTPLALAKQVCETAAAQNSEAHRDDITAVALFVENAGTKAGEKTPAERA